VSYHLNLTHGANRWGKEPALEHSMATTLGHSRTRILRALLHAAGPLGVDYLTKRLEISRNATYQHITALERDGLIEKAEITATGGRPGQTYQLTAAGRALFPKHYALFANLLVGAVKARIGAKDLEACLSELGQSLAINFKDRLAGLDPEQQIEELTRIIHELGYEAETVPVEGGEPEIRAHNCVFHDLAREHPEVCKLDLALMSALLGRGIDHVECITRGGSCCRFRVKPKPAN
jgi:DeoR family suf operon transcriptional repressor